MNFMNEIFYLIKNLALYNILYYIIPQLITRIKWWLSLNKALIRALCSNTYTSHGELTTRKCISRPLASRFDAVILLGAPLTEDRLILN